MIERRHLSAPATSGTFFNEDDGLISIQRVSVGLFLSLVLRLTAITTLTNYNHKACVDRSM